MRPLARSLTAAIVATTMLCAMGCGYVVVSGVALMAGGGGGGGGGTTTVDAGTSSSAEITALPRASAAPVQVVRARVADKASRPVSLRLEFALPPSATASPALA